MITILITAYIICRAKELEPSAADPIFKRVVVVVIA
jgi:hypothetical protein